MPWTRAWRKPLLHFVIALLGFGSVAAGVLYSLVELPADPVQPQASVLLYADASTVLARVGLTDRSDVPLDRVPVYVRHAVLAAEDRAFYSHIGVSAKGVLRALWSNLTSDSTQGASTITQQYVRNAYLTLDQTASRKAKEMLLSVKLERRDSKDQILEHYLNTIYFGRGAYGLEAAARAYFDVDVAQLTKAQGLVLAAVIKDPTGLDPGNEPVAAKDRWGWIADGMVLSGWLTTSDRAALVYPVVQPVTEDGVGPAGYLIDRVEREINGWGVTDQQLHTAGLRIVTTLDVATQAAVVAAARAARSSLADEPGAAVVALDPRDGSVRGYYGGECGRGYFDDAVAARPPGRLFQPIVVAQALTMGIGIGSRWNGASPRNFPDRGGVPLYNRGDADCSPCRLDQAIRGNISTAVYAVAQKVGPDKVANLARLAGVAASYDDIPSLVDAPNEPKPGHTRADVALGRYPVSVADLASVYATFADNGVHADRHFLDTVGAADDSWGTRRSSAKRTVLPPGVAADLSSALTSFVAPPVPALSGGKIPDTSALARDLKGSLGAATPAAISAAVPWGDGPDPSGLWCASYVPELAVVGWVGRDPSGALRDSAGKAASTDTADAMCAGALTGMAGRTTPLPRPAHVGSDDAGEISG